MNGQGATSVRVPLPHAWAVYGSGNTFNHYEHLDWLGTSRLSSNQSRAMTSDIAYAPFGEAYASTATSGVAFTGMRSDIAQVSGNITTGLYDFPARELQPSQGRWLSPDPAHASSNAYAYTTNPLSVVDPSGLMGTPEDITPTCVTGVCTSGNPLGAPDPGNEDNLIYNGENAPGPGNDGLDICMAPNAECVDIPVDDTNMLVPYEPVPDDVGSTTGGSSTTNNSDTLNPMAQAIFHDPVWGSAAGTMNLMTGIYAGAFGGMMAAPTVAAAGLAVGHGISTAAATAGYYIGYSQAWLAGTGGVLLGKYVSSTQNYMLDAQELGVGYFNLGNYGWRVANYLGAAQAANQGFIDAAVQRGPIYLGSVPVGATGSYAWELQYLFSLGVQDAQIIPAWQW